MASAMYIRGSDGTWFNQASTGGYAIMRCGKNLDVPTINTFMVQVSYDGNNWNWLTTIAAQATAAAAQTQLDNYAAALNAGTA